MSDNSIKIPATGAGGFATLAFFDQLFIVLAIGAAAFLAAVLLAKLWRRNKKINEA